MRVHALLLALLLAAGCESTPPPPDPAALQRLAQQSQLSMPPSAILAFEERDERAQEEGFGRWIVSAREPFRLPGEVTQISAETVRKVLERNLSRNVLGDNSGPDAEHYRWSHGGSAWRASVLGTTTGHHLVLEKSRN